MNGVAALDRIRIVLSHPTHPGNIGAAARAMKTMGLSRLVLVNPTAFPDPVADARASGAGDILAAARVVATLGEALEGTVFQAALTARRRELSLPVAPAREAALEVVDFTRHGEVAVVFGTEMSGLSNEELAYCQRPVTIPTNPGFSSLNLGAAVQLLCYELRMACGVSLPETAVGEPATFDEVEGFHGHLERVMRRVEFFNPVTSRRLVPRLRRLFGRVRLERDEINILRGFLAAVEQKTD
ncbi:MAG: RNA methyltransferase [Rhodocyclaceae bacterium]|jgi:tRNA/rRNA methyltransferase|nr:RNA methyltransferase [Rhodocyclaceae bacterium]